MSRTVIPGGPLRCFLKGPQTSGRMSGSLLFQTYTGPVQEERINRPHDWIIGRNPCV